MSTTNPTTAPPTPEQSVDDARDALLSAIARETSTKPTDIAQLAVQQSGTILIYGRDRSLRRLQTTPFPREEASA